MRVLIHAASPIVRAGLEALLAGRGDLAVVDAAPDEPLVERVEATEPDVVLLDADPRDPPPLPLPLAPDALSRAPAVVLLVDAPTTEDVAAALRAGARAVLPRMATMEEIVAAVEAAGAGLVSLPATLAEAVFDAGPRADARVPVADAMLTPREAEVLAMLAEGRGNKRIASRLGISEHTVKAHLAAIFAKLGASSRTEAVTIGARRGLIVL